MIRLVEALEEKGNLAKVSLLFLVVFLFGVANCMPSFQFKLNE